MIKIKTEEREILRSTFYQIATEIKTQNPKASAQEIKETMKDIIDVSV